MLPSQDDLPKDHLRKVEQDVLIPKKLRALGMQLCAEYVEGICAANYKSLLVYFEITFNIYLRKIFDPIHPSKRCVGCS